LAHVAELVDAADSKSAVRKGVKVRFLSWALVKIKSLDSIIFQGFFLFQGTLQGSGYPFST
jgi:hypothetical protein